MGKVRLAMGNPGDGVKDSQKFFEMIRVYFWHVVLIASLILVLSISVWLDRFASDILDRQESDEQLRIDQIGQSLEQIADFIATPDPNRTPGKLSESGEIDPHEISYITEKLVRKNAVGHALNVGVIQGHGDSDIPKTSEWIIRPLPERAELDDPSDTEAELAEKKKQAAATPAEGCYFLNTSSDKSETELSTQPIRKDALASCNTNDPATGAPAWLVAIDIEVNKLFVAAYVPIAPVEARTSNSFRFRIYQLIIRALVGFLVLVTLLVAYFPGKQKSRATETIRGPAYLKPVTPSKSPTFLFDRRWMYVIAFALIGGFCAVQMLHFLKYDPSNDHLLKDSPDNLLTEIRTSSPPKTIYDRDRELTIVGIEIDSLVIGDGGNVTVAGTIWQSAEQLDNIPVLTQTASLPVIEFPDALGHNSLLTGAESQTTLVRIQSVGTLDPPKTIARRFVEIIPWTADQQAFPFDRDVISIRIAPKDHSSRLILFPDFTRYQIAYPIAKPGLKEGLTVRGFGIEESYFSYKPREYGPVEDPLAGNGSSAMDLIFNVKVSRLLVPPMFSRLVPIGVVIIMLFAVLLVVEHSIRGNRDGSVNLLTYCAALFFVSILSHVSLRQELSSPKMTYMDYYYVITYCAILFVTTDIIFLTIRRSLAPNPSNYVAHNKAATLAFWPVVTTAIVGVTMTL